MDRLADTAPANECRQCCTYCDRLVHPAGCLQSGCRYLYLYEDERSGRQYMGCVNHVFKVEIDREVFAEAERTRHGFGGVKMTGTPLPQCHISVERAYDGAGEAFECVNPGFFASPARSPDLTGGAFDLRDRL